MSHVLFVDDEPENLAVFEAACAERFSVLTTSTAAEALELLRSHEVAVLLADQRMPGMTGLELLEKVHTLFPEVVRMLVTAYSDLQTATDAINRGQVRRYLKKPWEHDELLSTLSEGVDYYQMRSKLHALERRLCETERVYSLGFVTAGLARELRAPADALAAHITKARGLLLESTKTIPPTTPGASAVRAQLSLADNELAGALQRAEHVLDVARGVEVPSGSGAHESADATEVLRLTIRLMQVELRTLGSLEVDVRPVPRVSGSPTQLSQVLLNLFVQALGAMADKPREDRRLSIRLRADAEWVVIEVRDSGRGASRDLLDKSLERSLVRGSPRGFGLGLAISKTIVSELGGILEANDLPEGGACSRVKLPQHKPPPAAS
jgi:signal transduction histidine kinase